ncbi:hypothetical protein M569_16754, partial [Genlisea aurea]
LSITHPTTGRILKQTGFIFYSNIVTFVFLSSLVLAFRSNVHTASHYLSSLIDGDPSLKSLLYRLDLSAGGSRLNQQQQQQLPYRRRRAFLHVSRVGYLDDDFFSGDSDFDRSLFHPSPRKPVPNSTYLLLSNLGTDSGFSDSAADNGIHFPETVRSRLFGFKPEFKYTNMTARQDEEKEGAEAETRANDGNGAVFDLNFLLKGLELGDRDATTLVFFVGVLSATYAYVIFGFVVTYTWVNGIIFLKVLNHLLGKNRSFMRVIWDGSLIGLRRLTGFTLMRWAVRDAIAQLIGILLFGDIKDQYVFFKIFLRMKFMPFANLAPWVIDHELESSCFILAWFLSDLVLGFVFSVDTWVVIVDRRRVGREILTEGFHLLLLLFGSGFKMRLLEGAACGWYGKWILRRVFGDLAALVIQSLMEVYFAAAWLVFYLAAKHGDESTLGRRFGRWEFEALLEAAR